MESRAASVTREPKPSFREKSLESFRFGSFRTKPWKLFERTVTDHLTRKSAESNSPNKLLDHSRLFTLVQTLFIRLTKVLWKLTLQMLTKNKLNFTSTQGLDPAAPGYLDMDSKEVRSRRLNPSCATFVDVIHTSSAAGLAAPLGHIDFYPNGGNEQPGCPEIRSIWSYFIDKVHNTVCSHGRSHEYWAESIIEQHHWFASCKCSEAVDDLNEAAAYDPEDDEKKYNDGKCDCNHLIEMGERAAIQKESGIFFLTTNPQFPSAKTKIERNKNDEL